MRRWILMTILGLAAAGCGDVDGDAPDAQGPVYKECEAPSARIETMEQLEAFGAQGCEALTSLSTLKIYGPSITTLEPLRGLRRVQQLWIDDTSITTLEPLRDLADVVIDVSFDGNTKLSYCELTGWIAAVKSSDPNKNFGVTIDNPRQNDPCATVNYP